MAFLLRATFRSGMELMGSGPVRASLPTRPPTPPAPTRMHLGCPAVGDGRARRHPSQRQQPGPHSGQGDRGRTVWRLWRPWLTGRPAGHSVARGGKAESEGTSNTVTITARGKGRGSRPDPLTSGRNSSGRARGPCVRSQGVTWRGGGPASPAHHTSFWDQAPGYGRQRRGRAPRRPRAHPRGFSPGTSFTPAPTLVSCGLQAGPSACLSSPRTQVLLPPPRLSTPRPPPPQ